ncbi:glycine betaine ABC transporter substrate-binding protein [Maridesulfovibrio frigidus]|uniref:glycine betaine ABC transporter substrate-binding protein n=1 Tax=Maridesulfovibrio frigidus TaxID=340956 RepID=UPI0004E258D8|nr:glycine betaine ABC transporter substrate-binding protein [Maridesulfovibrio frigidus]
MKTCLIRLFVLLVLVLTIPTSASAAEKIKFGAPLWPGVTPKTHIVAQIISAMGYQSELIEVGPPVIYKSMGFNDMDIFLGGWTPQQDPMLDPQVKAGKVVKVRSNLSDALIGVCVSDAAYEGGIKSLDDVHKYPEKFGKTIYNIEAGTGMHTAMESILKDNVGQLGDWEHVGTATSVMLAGVTSRINKGDWVVFGCWKPHWMDVEMDIHFLKGIPGSEAMISGSSVYTVTRGGFAADYPEIQKLLENFSITSQTQSEWISEYSYKNNPADQVASKWISANLDQVKGWLKNVKTIDGKDAFEAVKAKYAKQ